MFSGGLRRDLWHEIGLIPIRNKSVSSKIVKKKIPENLSLKNKKFNECLNAEI